jgi:Cu(I)/Ag(I) efflux system membrane fusion protein
MKKNVFFLVLALVIAAGSFWAGSLYIRPAAPPAGPVFLDSGDDGGDHPPGTVRVRPEKQQLIGVRVGLVEKKGLTQVIRNFGRVAVDENRIYRLIAPTEGWLVDVQGGTTGSLVTKDQILSKVAGRDIFNRDIISNQQALLVAASALERKKAEKAPENIVAAAAQQVLVAERNLMGIGMGQAQIKELVRTRVLAQEIEVRSPVTGLVLSRNAFPDLRFERNTELYRIADLSRVWILADVYENEAAYFKPGIEARVTLTHQKRSFQARVSKVLPVFDATTRTLKVRLEVDNPGYALRPDMFVDVEFPVQLPPAITVPMDAVIDSGLKKTVFVERGNGFFEPRSVDIGWRLGNRVEIVKGLSAGEKIVTSGAFLIDSESRMELAASGISSSLSRDPVSGLEVSPRKSEKSGLKSSYRGQTYYFSSQESLSRFNQNPSAYASKTGLPPEPEGRQPSLEKEAAPNKGRPPEPH